MDTSCRENIQSGLLLVWIQVVGRTFNLNSYLYGYKLYGEHSIWTLTCMDTSCRENIQSGLLLVWIQVVGRIFNLDSYFYTLVTLSCFFLRLIPHRVTQTYTLSLSLSLSEGGGGLTPTSRTAAWSRLTARCTLFIYLSVYVWLCDQCTT